MLRTMWREEVDENMRFIEGLRMKPVSVCSVLQAVLIWNQRLVERRHDECGSALQKIVKRPS